MGQRYRKVDIETEQDQSQVSDPSNLEANHQLLSSCRHGVVGSLGTLASPVGGVRNRPRAFLLLLPPPPPQGHYVGYPSPGFIWYDQHYVRSYGSPYMNGSTVFVAGFPIVFMYPSQFTYYSHPGPPYVQGVPHVASSASYRVPPRSFSPRHSSIQHRRGDPRLRETPDDDVSEFGEFFRGYGTNHHRDMRLDTEEMSYEELRASRERIGAVSIGLSEEEEDVKTRLKTRTCSGGINLEEEEEESEPCTICQESLEKDEKIATLECGHEYHVECLVKWLNVKNVCPICRSKALVINKTRQEKVRGR
ncbi:unnamed protein product [Cochlearia groenlandica]